MQLVDAAEVKRLKAELNALKSAQGQPAQQPTQKPYGWHVTGTAELICGDDAENEAEQKAKQCGGASQAIALYANPPDTASAPQQAAELVDAELEACSALMADLRSKSRNHLFRSALKIAELELRARMDQSQRNHPQTPLRGSMIQRDELTSMAYAMRTWASDLERGMQVFIPASSLMKVAESLVAPKPVQEPVAIVDEDDDGIWAEILPDRTVKVGQMLYATTPDTTALLRQSLAAMVQARLWVRHEMLDAAIDATRKHLGGA